MGLEGRIFKNNDGHEAIVLKEITSDKSRRFLVKFLESGYVTNIERSNLYKGSFKDYGRPTVWGVGYTYKGASKKGRVHSTWTHMLERCYYENGDNYQWYGGQGVKVSDRWLHFKNFEEDIKEIPGYKEFINSKIPREYSLDKDILGDGMLYSKENCMFVNQKQQMKAQKRVSKIKSVSPNGEVRIHDSINDTCRVLGVQNANLYKVLNGERKHTLGYTFERI